MRLILLITSLFAFSCYGIFSGYTYTMMQKEKKMLMENQTIALSIAYQAITQMYSISIENYFHDMVMQAPVLSLLREAKHADEATKSKLRGSLYKLLYPQYHDTLSKVGIRQFQFHTAKGESFLRFHNPTESGDLLVDIRPSIKKANIDKQIVVGFEGGRNFPGFRYVFPIVDSDDEHLGSVEFSMPYESIEKELSKLLLGKNSILLLKKSISTDLVFSQHKQTFSPSMISDDFVIENADISTLNAKVNHSSIVQTINFLLQNEATLPTKLKEGKSFTLLLFDNTMEGYVASFHAINDTSNQLAAYALTYSALPELTQMQKKYLIQFIFGFMITTLLVIAFYILLQQRKRILFEKMQFETIVKKTTNGIILLNNKGIVTFINQAGCTLLGYSAHELIGEIAHTRIHVHDNLNEENECRIMEAMRQQKTYVAEEKLRTKEGEQILVHLTSTPFLLDLQHIGTVIIFRNITQEKHDQELIHHLAYYDNLTELPNRRLLLDRLDYTINLSRRTLDYCGLLFIDIDNFKILNDTKGHDTGDMLLINIAQRLKEAVRVSDTVSRFGGDEFVVLVTKLGVDESSAKEELHKLARKLLDVLSCKYHLETNHHFFSYHCTASIGGTTFFDGSKDVNQILKDADIAMYTIKKNGKNEICIL